MKSFATLAIVVLMLAGCATYRPPKIRNPGDGAVVMRVLPNLDGGAAMFFKNWADVTVARTPSAPGEPESRFLLTPTLDGTSRTAVYAGGLPPGDYRFVQFSSQRCGAICVSASLNVSPEFSHFHIEHDRLTDLGVITQSGNPGHPEEPLLIHDAAADHPETPEIVRELVPDLAALTQETPLSWNPASEPAAMAKLRAYTLTHSAGLASPRAIDGGGFIYGTANGVLMTFSPGVGATAYDVGVRSSIDTVLVSGEGDWLVGGELGVLRVSKNRGRSWQSIRGSIPFGVVEDLVQWHDQIIVTTLRGKDVYIHAAAAGSAAWRQLAHYQLEVGFWDIQGGRPQSFLAGDSLVTTIPGRKMAYLDLSTGQSETRSLPGAISSFAVSADGLLRCVCVAVIAENPYESNDLGKTWKGSSISRFMRLPTFRDAKHGVAFKGAVFSHAKMVYTEDGGVTWVETTDAPEGARQVFYSKDGSVAYIGTGYGAFWATRDDGKTWQSLSN